MPKVYFKGDAQGRAQVTHVTPANVEIGDIFKLTINRKTIQVTATAATVADVVTRFVSAIGQFNNAIPEWAEVSASIGRNDANEITHLVLTGLSDGTPFTVTSSTTNVSGFDVIVTEVVAGAAAQNMKQRITLPGPPTGGTFTLTFAGQTTAAIAWNATANDVDTALENLSNIPASGVNTTKNADGDWTVEFSGGLAGINQPVLTGNGTNLTGGASGVVTVTTEGKPTGTSYEATLELTADDDVHLFRFKFVGDPASFSGLAYYSKWISNEDAGATADDIREALRSIMVPGTLVSDTATIDPPPAQTPLFKRVDVVGPAGGPWQITIRETNTQSLSGNADEYLLIDSTIYTAPNVTVATGDNVTLTLVGTVSGSPANEVQIIRLINGPTGGTFTLTFNNSEVTGNIAWNASAATVQTALEGLASIGVGDVAVAGSAGGPWTVTFQGALAAADVMPMTVNGALLTGSNVVAEVIQGAKAGTNEQQSIGFVDIPTGGTFTLTFNAETTGTIAYNATAATVQAALEGLATPVPGDIAATGGPLPTKPVVIEFKGAYAKFNTALMTADGSSLTGSNTQTLTVAANTVEPTGPHHLDEPLNWSGGAIPVAGDEAYFADINTDVFYGLAGIADTLAAVHFMASFTGKFGLKPVNEDGYYEYRPLGGTLKATLVLVGEGRGSGSPYININSSTVQTELIIYATGSPEDASIPALVWKGTNAANVVRLFKGSFGAAILPGEVATIATLQIGYLADREADAEYLIGSGTTLTTIEISGGDGQIDLGTANATSLTCTGGTVVINGSFGVSTTFVIGPDADQEATVVWNTTGTLGGAPIVSGAGKLDFSQDMRAKTVTNPIEVNSAEAIIDDPWKAVTNLRLDLNYAAAAVNGSRVGNNVRLTRGTPA